MFKFSENDVHQAYERGYRHGVNQTRLNWIGGVAFAAAIVLVLAALL